MTMLFSIFPGLGVALFGAVSCGMKGVLFANPSQGGEVSHYPPVSVYYLYCPRRYLSAHPPLLSLTHAAKVLRYLCVLPTSIDTSNYFELDLLEATSTVPRNPGMISPAGAGWGMPPFGLLVSGQKQHRFRSTGVTFRNAANR